MRAANSLGWLESLYQFVFHCIIILAINLLYASKCLVLKPLFYTFFDIFIFEFLHPTSIMISTVLKKVIEDRKSVMLCAKNLLK